jgi:rod shape-determining protein MreC
VASRSKNLIYASALPWRAYAQRFSYVLLLGVALGLLVIGQSKPAVMAHVRLQVIDALAPALDAVSRPLELTSQIVNSVMSYANLRVENAQLKAANVQLTQWQNAALALQQENRELRALLNYRPEPGLSYITARVIADAGGAFVRSLVITAGKQDGVREGMAAMTGDGLIGRVIEVGDWSSRILLMTDVNSRIPVMLSDSGDHAILAGDNAPEPRLLYLSLDADVKLGARVVTSGHGGVFPPNLAVGVVSAVDPRAGATVTPIAALGRINHVRLVDFSLKGGAVNDFTAQLQPASDQR